MKIRTKEGGFPAVLTGNGREKGDKARDRTVGEPEKIMHLIYGESSGCGKVELSGDGTRLNQGKINHFIEEN